MLGRREEMGEASRLDMNRPASFALRVIRTINPSRAATDPSGSTDNWDPASPSCTRTCPVLQSVLWGQSLPLTLEQHRATARGQREGQRHPTPASTPGSEEEAQCLRHSCPGTLAHPLGRRMRLWKSAGVDGKVSLSCCTSVSSPPPRAAQFLN